MRVSIVTTTCEEEKVAVGGGVALWEEDGDYDGDDGQSRQGGTQEEEDAPPLASEEGDCVALWSPQHLKDDGIISSLPQPQQQQQQPLSASQLNLSCNEPVTPVRDSMNGSFSNKLPPSALRSSCTPGKNARISFGQVEIRKYRVSHGGATSTPSKGAYPIGLSWEVAEEETKPLDKYEAFRSPVHPSASPRRFSEKERKRLLEKVDVRTYFEKQASFETEKEELKQLRRARANIGCHCTSPSSCGTSRCICFKEDLACNDDSCRCTCANCVNPKRYNFDQDRIDNYRRRRILEAPYAASDVGATASTECWAMPAVPATTAATMTLL